MTRNATTLPVRSIRPAYDADAERGEFGFPEAAAAAGGTMLLAAASGRGRTGIAMRITGAALLGFALKPMIVRGVEDAGGKRRTLSASASIDIARSTREVFAFFKDFECFPKVKGVLRSVADFQDGRSHWEMYTPSGGIVAFDVVVTKFVPQAVIGWESVRGSPVQMTGIARFTPRGEDATTVNVELAFKPEHTRFADALFMLTRRHTSDRLSDALDRARFYLESMPSVSDTVAE